MRKKRKKKAARHDTSSKARKTAKRKASVRQTVPRTRNNGTYTESQFWQMIRSALREKSRWWKPRLEALKNARRISQSSNKRLKWEFQCNECKNWFPQRGVEVHHSIEAGKLNSYSDLSGFVERLFSETGWEVKCKGCHSKLHKKQEK